MVEISRRTFIHAGAAAAASVALPKSAIAELRNRRNVLFIAVDDLNTSLRCYGVREMHTPHLDALAARGTRFNAAYCQYPLCGPSRASLMTGLAPDTTGVLGLKTFFRDNLPDVVTIGQSFRRNGYYSARVGKIYHAGVPEDIGTSGQDDAASWDYVFNPDGVDHTKDEHRITNFTPKRAHWDEQGRYRIGSTISFYEAPQSDGEMTDALGANEVIRLMKENRSRPFFLAYGLYRPHVPWIVPKPYFDMYPLESIEARPFRPEELKLAPEAAYWTKPPNFGMDELERRKAIRAYYASVSFVDTQVGRVLAALKNLDLEENTVVVFWADHGWSLGEHGQWMKQTLFEPATRVPTIFAGPGTGKGRVCYRTTEHLDIYPTLAELCGLKDTPGNLHGASLVPLFNRPEAPWDKPAISQVARPPGPNPKIEGYSLRNEHYRYTSWQGGKTGEELYDYKTDPHELRNLAADVAFKRVKAALREELETITKKRGRIHGLGQATA